MFADVELKVGPQDFPKGTVGGKYRISVSGTVNESQDVDSTTATFVLPDGTYTVSAQRLDDAGNALGDAFSDTFTISEVTTVTIDVVKGITVTLRS